MHRKHNIALIYGSAREGRFCDTVADWAATQITRQAEFSLNTIDPATLDLPARLGGADGPAMETVRHRATQADAFIVVTPEYNHSYPAVLKALIDLMKAPWQAKPVGFVSYGGISGGLRAVEQLRLVFAELHAVTIRDTVSFANASTLFNEAVELRAPEPAEQAMDTMLRHLNWWTTALREAREAVPYSQVAA